MYETRFVLSARLVFAPERIDWVLYDNYSKCKTAVWNFEETKTPILDVTCMYVVPPEDKTLFGRI